MPLFWSVLMMVFGFLALIVAATCFRRYTQFGLACVGTTLIIGGIVLIIVSAYQGADERKQIRKAKADIKVRTVIVRGVVYSSAHKNGWRYCRVVLEEERMNTFVLAERNSMGQNCANIKRGDVVKVKFVKPQGKYVYVEDIEALDFIDFADVDPPYPPETPTRE